jgi:hypothetical protein
MLKTRRKRDTHVFNVHMYIAACVYAYIRKQNCVHARAHTYTERQGMHSW